MRVTARYDFGPNIIDVDVLVEIRNGEKYITPAPIYLLTDSNDWKIYWRLIKGEGVDTLEFPRVGGLVIDPDVALPDRFNVHRICNCEDTTQWYMACNNQVSAEEFKVPYKLPYTISPCINGEQLSYDPSIAVTSDPIPTCLLPQPAYEGPEVRLVTQRVEEGKGEPIGVQAATRSLAGVE